jgi:hypothetical protein
MPTETIAITDVQHRRHRKADHREGPKQADNCKPWRSAAMPTRSAKQMAAAKISGRPTHVILATRADGSDAVRIGSAWQRVSGDLHPKLDLMPPGYQQIVVLTSPQVHIQSQVDQMSSILSLA